MGRKSKETEMLELFFNYPTKQWHFKELEKRIKIAQSKIAKWLKRFQDKSLIKKIRPKGKMPYYISNYEKPAYRYKKRIFAFEKLYLSGLLSYLSSLENAKSIILFGSFSRSDWSKESDIDIFIYGEVSEIKIGKFEKLLHRDIQIFLCEDKNSLQKMGPGLIKNIIKGTTLKGTITDELIANACV